MTVRLPLAAAIAVLVGALLASGCGGSSAPGDAIAFVSTRDGDYAIFGMNADGTDQGRLTDEKGDPEEASGVYFQMDPAWSPDGSRIAFASSRAGSLDIYVMNADGSDTRQLTSGETDDAHPTWSADGTRIAFARDEYLFVMDADGSNQKRLTRALAPEAEPAWSPDGRWIAYQQRTRGTPVREIWVVAASGGSARRVTNLGRQCYTPSWAPDGRSLAFSSNARGGRFGIFTIGIDGQGLRRVTPAGSPDAFEPSWSPDGNTIALSSGGSIVTIDPQGAATVITDPSDNDSSPVWNPQPGAEDQ